MPEVTSHEVGTFCWADVFAPDAKKAADFYNKLFGWEIEELPPEAGGYIQLNLRGKPVAAATPPQGEEDKNIPPHWNTYISVDDAEQYAKKAEAAGGTIIVPAMDVMDVGAFAVIADPTGAAVGLWQPKKHIGTEIVQEPGTLSWTELMPTDTAAARTFYEDVFGWTSKTMPMPSGEYTLFMKGETQVAGMMEMPPDMKAGGGIGYWGLYFNVADTDAAVAKAQELGAQVVLPPNEAPGAGRFAILSDTQGAVFGVVKPEPQ